MITRTKSIIKVPKELSIYFNKKNNFNTNDKEWIKKARVLLGWD